MRAEDSAQQELSLPPENALVVDIDGFEGPLDLLLTLARGQKVDLREISILHLAEQYLEFIAEARRLRLELAADYLVMAAWLAYLKSRLLLPPPPEEEGPSAEEMAANLAFQLERLQGIRKVAARLMARDQLGRDIFPCQIEDRHEVEITTCWTASLLDLLHAYARNRTRDDYQPLHMNRRPVLAIDAAMAHMKNLLGNTLDWTTLAAFLPPEWQNSQQARTAVASTFAASLEHAKNGLIQLRQEGAFGPISIRQRPPEAEDLTDD